MKKILIISYFYPPCNLTAAQRVQGWAKYLHESGYYPTIVTRNWDRKIESPEDVLRSSGDRVIHEKTATHEVYYLPYKAGLRDRIFTRLAGTRWQGISKVFTLIELVAENFTTRFIPHKNLYHFSKKLLSDDRSIQQVVISGNPFNLFFFGYLLNKKLGVQWVADYRDDWNTSELDNKPGKNNSKIARLQAKSEQKWVVSAASITSVSDYYVEKIAHFVQRPGQVVLNGYEIQLPDPVPHLSKEIFRITYNGSLYSSQPIEIFLEAFKELVQKYSKQINFMLHFPGLAFDPIQEKRVRQLTKGFEVHVEISPRLPKNEVIDLQLKSDVLLMVAHTNIKGVPSSKLFEYIGLKRPILVVPSDHDVIEQLVLETKSGAVADSVQECFVQLENWILLKLVSHEHYTFQDREKAALYSRQHQTALLAKVLDSLEQ